MTGRLLQQRRGAWGALGVFLAGHGLILALGGLGLLGAGSSPESVGRTIVRLLPGAGVKSVLALVALLVLRRRG